ncbi:MAG TPA: RNA polymerase sporulation sigma factor SigH [Acidimicrobiales bacterium]|nr:RNA polymerase sporulation sigma factor SigH [Acidimicrobiales bacterium]
MASTPLTDIADDELAARFQAGDRLALEALIARYRRFARAKSRGYFLVGGDADDIEQEALIGLYKAARDFRPEHQASFRAFAELCITRQIITAIKTATRQKHQPLNQYVSISGVRGGDDPGERSVEELLHSHHDGDPADNVISSERMQAMRSSMADMLSGLEVDVLKLYVEGKSYQEIGAQLGRHVKSIDNALQRIKRKLDHHLQLEAAHEAHELASIG